MINLLSMKACNSSNHWLNPQTFIITCSALLLVQFVYGFLFHPHRVWTTLFEQNCPMETSNLAGLKVSADVRQEVTQTQRLLDANGYRPGDPLLALYDRPGLVYALGGRSIGIPWYYRLSPHNDESTVSEYLPKVSKRFFLILEDAKMTPGMVAAFDKAGASYPDAFRFLGAVPKSGQKDYGNKLYLFAHKTGDAVK